MARRWLWWLVLLGVLLVVISRFTNLQHLGDALARAHWSWIVVATLLHAAFFLLHGNLYRLGFQAVGVSSTVAGLLPVFFASTSLTAVPPSAPWWSSSRTWPPCSPSSPAACCSSPAAAASPTTICSAPASTWCS
ncbi:MAG: hypothetical protein P8Y05_04845 [Deinococcales bacterium]